MSISIDKLIGDDDTSRGDLVMNVRSTLLKANVGYTPLKGTSEIYSKGFYMIYTTAIAIFLLQGAALFLEHASSKMPTTNPMVWSTSCQM